MAERVQVIADGAEILLLQGEPYAIQSKQAGSTAERRVTSTGPRPLSIRYLGFKNVGGRREYALQAGRGDEANRYTVSIELAAFAGKQALLQDGPDICYQKLLRELTDSEAPVPEGIVVTDADLADYRAAHTKPGPKSFATSGTPSRAPAKA